MNKKAILALLVALMIPVVSYLLVRFYSTDAVVMPKKYLPDTVLTKVVDGKMETDTVWHKIANIRLQNQLGDTVALYDKPGKIMVMDFFFTSCGGICPAMTRNMSKLQQSFIKGGNTRRKIDTSIVQFVSFTIDPERDSAHVLKKYADKMGVNHDNWWMLTGNRDTIYNFAFNELKVDKFAEGPVSPDFVHTNRFVLIDKQYHVRGYYNGLDSASLKKLARDIGLLLLEKDRTKKSTVFTQIIDLSWLWLIIVVLVTGFVLFFRSKQKAENAR
jgi:protein SCO1/2